MSQIDPEKSCLGGNVVEWQGCEMTSARGSGSGETLSQMSSKEYVRPQPSWESECVVTVAREMVFLRGGAAAVVGQEPKESPQVAGRVRAHLAPRTYSTTARQHHSFPTTA